ncbi:hypothetical protein BD311DRAFT_780244 [Dichomitus squalens]|uniref:Uncharacterized protein n=1 Tax=Dichomitus squalens TaxID=114155 RepID=A0A4Q9ME02_9APHY|nr:hypothetical protein BD311DRAFT_780244 [Dichomitus squalens]
MVEPQTSQMGRIRCPTCPWLGVNLPDGWDNDPEKWKYMVSIALDGNFTAQHRPMRNPDKDMPLADGHMFMVMDGSYREHLRSAKEYQEALTCHDHRAVLNASLGRGKFEATGIGAAACSRHRFFFPHACVDFQKGKGYTETSFYPKLMMPDGLTIHRGIGQFHVHGHQMSCFPRYSVNFIPGAGM